MEISILVVDDHLTFNKTLVNALNKEGFNAAGCSDLHSARHLFERMNPDIVLLDIVLGGEKVFSLIECFRRQNNARILVMSEHNDLRTKRSVMKKARMTISSNHSAYMKQSINCGRSSGGSRRRTGVS